MSQQQQLISVMTMLEVTSSGHGKDSTLFEKDQIIGLHQAKKTSKEDFFQEEMWLKKMLNDHN